MEQQIKVGAVSYLNTKPLLYGIERSAVMQQIDLMVDYPAKIASLLLDQQIDIGLVPVAIIPSLPEHYIVTDYCIGTNGEVASVALFSQVPIAEIETVLLDFQSRTSVKLAQILLQQYWKKEVIYQPATPNFRDLIHGTTAAVVIGDRAFEQSTLSPYCYDLGTAWKDFTGLPFVFAAWVANKQLPSSFIEAFNTANALGLSHLPDVIAANPYPLYDLNLYYTHNISYTLTQEKRKGLERFLQLLSGV